MVFHNYQTLLAGLQVLALLLNALKTDFNVILPELICSMQMLVGAWTVQVGKNFYKSQAASLTQNDERQFSDPLANLEGITLSADSSLVATLC